MSSRTMTCQRGLVDILSGSRFPAARMSALLPAAESTDKVPSMLGPWKVRGRWRQAGGRHVQIMAGFQEGDTSTCRVLRASVTSPCASCSGVSDRRALAPGKPGKGDEM